MKKVVIAFCAAALVMVGTVSVFAAGGVNCANAMLEEVCGKQMKVCVGGSRAYYVDADDDEVCDNRTWECADRCGGSYADCEDDGVCDNKELECTGRCGANYVDADGDGVCDNRELECTGHGCENAGGSSRTDDNSRFSCRVSGGCRGKNR